MTTLAFRRPWRIVQRNVRAYRRFWTAFVSGFVEPVLYLFAIGVGVGVLAGDVVGPSGEPVPYRQFIAPAMLAVAAMNAVVFDATFNFFFKFKYARTFDAILATPVAIRDLIRGEMAWSLLRSSIYGAIFVATMLAFGLVRSWWAILAVPVAILVGFGFAGVGFAATTFMRSFIDFDYVSVFMIPLFLFSATFFPLSTYPRPLQLVVAAFPLYHGVELLRGLLGGDVHLGLLGHAAYFVAMGLAGLALVQARLEALLVR
jgi:lipooligosaccharide transport system permease protein